MIARGGEVDPGQLDHRLPQLGRVGNDAWALGLSGADQTFGRTLHAPLASNTGVTAHTCVLIALGGATAVEFSAVPGPFPLLVVIAIAEDMMRGNLTLLRCRFQFGMPCSGALTWKCSTVSLAGRSRSVSRSCPLRVAVSLAGVRNA